MLSVRLTSGFDHHDVAVFVLFSLCWTRDTFLLTHCISPCSPPSGSAGAEKKEVVRETCQVHWLCCQGHEVSSWTHVSGQTEYVTCMNIWKKCSRIRTWIQQLLLDNTMHKIFNAAHSRCYKILFFVFKQLNWSFSSLLFQGYSQQGERPDQGHHRGAWRDSRHVRYSLHICELWRGVRWGTKTVMLFMFCHGLKRDDYTENLDLKLLFLNNFEK